MADITMCKGDGCSAKDQCYRYTAPPNDLWQSYFVHVPGKDARCEHFWQTDHKSYEDQHGRTCRADMPV